MLKHLRFLFLFVISFSLSSALTSCGGDDNDENPDDPAQYEIVGKWQRITTTGTLVIEFDESGYLYWERIGVGNGTGSWTYNGKDKIWTVQVSVIDIYPGQYKIIGDKLIDPDNNVFTRVSDSSSSPLAGTSWQGTDKGEEQCSNLQITFNYNGTYTEIWNGITNTFSYSVTDNIITLDGNLSDSQLNCCLGRTLYYSLNSSKTELTIKDSMGWRMIFTKK
ncbi:MAG: hypothetical protein ACI4BC_11130 [Muribaculaceae bacterium]